MKIALTSEKNIQVLTASGAVAEHEVQILRAGLKKILSTGKNRIALELTLMDDLPAAVIREVATFDLLARELGGRIVLAGVSPLLRTKIEAFAQPPVILSFETREKAVEFLSLPPQPEIPPIAPSGQAYIPPIANAEVNPLQTRVHDLEAENRRLREQLVLATIARRPPADEPAYLAKIQLLEAKLEKILIAPPSSPPVAPAAR
jgi:anti-anti-sigma regulatory factor